MEGSLINTHPTSDGHDDHSGSPWDDPLPTEEEKPVRPKVVGSLDANVAETLPEEKPVPFNIPENVADEKVGKKILAKEVLKPNPEVIEDSKPNPVKSQPSNTNATSPAAIKQPVANPILKPPTPTSTPAPIKEGVNTLVKDNTDPVSIDKPLKSTPTPTPTPVSSSSEPVISSPNKLDDIKPQESSEFAAVELKPIAGENQKTYEPENLKTEEHSPAVQSLGSIQGVSDQSLAKKLKTKEDKTVKNKKVEKSKKDKTNILAKKKPLFGFLKKPVFLVFASIILLLVVLTYMTELGVLSIGLEKVYGLVGIEQLWGGLSKNPEKALAISSVKIKEDLNFKIRGSISLTVNKTIDSPITSPLVAYMGLPSLTRDENVGSFEKVRLIVSEYDNYYDYYNSASSSSTSTTKTPTPVETEADLGNQNDQESFKTEVATIKELNLDFEGTSSKDAVSLDLELKKLVGADEQINLIGSDNNLFVKSSGEIKFDPTTEANKWLNFVLSTIKSDNVFNDFLSIKSDSGFSVTGKRVANEKIGKTRCYKYKIETLEIGDSLKDLGIEKEVIQKISGDVWIAIKDKTIRKVDISIIPAISSSISRADIGFELYDYGVENSILIPTAGEIVGTNSTSSTQTDSSIEQVVISTDDTQRKEDLATIKTALVAYKKVHGIYPKASQLDKLNESSSSTKAALSAYLETMPTDPKASEGWYYAYISDGITFTLSARIEDTTDSQTTKVGNIYLYYLKN